MAFKRVHTIAGVAWVNGAPIPVSLAGLPPLAKVREFRVRAELLFTLGAAAAAIVSSQLHRLVSVFDLGQGRRGSGQYFRMLEWVMRGGQTSHPAGLPAANNETHRRNITWVIPFYDPRARNPLEACPNGADFKETELTIETAAFAGLGAGTWDTLASIAGTVFVEAVLDDPNGKVGSALEFGFKNLTGQTPELDGKFLYTDAFLYRESGATISSAEVATIAAQIDGRAFIDSRRLAAFAAAFNYAHAKGNSVQADSATVPVGGELLQESPAVTNGAAATVTIAGPVPIIVPPDRLYKLTKLARVESSARFDFTGTDTTFTVGYRRLRSRSEAEARAAFARIGVNPGSIIPDTESGKPLTAAKRHWARYMGLRAA